MMAGVCVEQCAFNGHTLSPRGFDRIGLEIQYHQCNLSNTTFSFVLFVPDHIDWRIENQDPLRLLSISLGILTVVRRAVERPQHHCARKRDFLEVIVKFLTLRLDGQSAGAQQTNNAKYLHDSDLINSDYG